VQRWEVSVIRLLVKYGLNSLGVEETIMCCASTLAGGGGFGSFPPTGEKALKESKLLSIGNRFVIAAYTL
jgi:hypothetical protein